MEKKEVELNPLSLTFCSLAFYVLLVYILDPAAGKNAGLIQWLLVAIMTLAGVVTGIKGKSKLTKNLSEEQLTGINTLVLSAMLSIFLITSLGGYKWFFFENHQVYWQIFAIAGLLTITIIIIPNLSKWIAMPLFIVAVSYVGYEFLSFTEGKMLYRDDHTAFAYRMALFRESFPSSYFYNPEWNGGYAASELLTTGILSFCYLLLPLVLTFDIDKLYTPALAIIFIGIIPIVYYFSLRAVKVDRFGAACGAILSIGVTRYFFINLLAWGVGPSLLSSALAPIIFALLYRSFILGHTDIFTGVALLMTAFFASLWPGAIFMLVPILAGFLTCLGRLDSKKIKFGIVMVVLYVLIILPWLLNLLEYGDVFEFNQMSESKPLQLNIAKALTSLGYIKFTNPVLLIFGFGGLAITNDKYLRRWLVIILFIYLLLIGFGNQYKDQFQFYRLVNPFAFFLIIPSAILIGRAFQLPQRWAAPAKALILATIIAGVINVSQIYADRGKEKYHTTPRDVNEMVDWIKKNTSPDGRILFAGKTMHAYGWAHVAIFPFLTGREMMAKDFYHFDIREILDYDIRPHEYRKNVDLTEEFFDLYNVSHITSYKLNWIKFLRIYPDLYKEETSFTDRFGTEKFIFSRIKWKPDWFIEGQGRVSAGINRISVHLEKPTPRVVLKYNWIEGLSTSSELPVSPYLLPGDIKLISVETNGVTDFEINFQ